MNLALIETAQKFLFADEREMQEAGLSQTTRGRMIGYLQPLAGSSEITGQGYRRRDHPKVSHREVHGIRRSQDHQVLFGRDESEHRGL